MKKRNRKKPKIVLLNKISESVKLLLKNLYPISEQLIILNNALDKKSSISENTYLKYLKSDLNKDYNKYKKNIFFAKRIDEIDELVRLFDNIEEQFNNLKTKTFNSGKMKFDLTIEDYLLFYNEYYKIYKHSK
jgi:alpha-galactosidase